MAVLGIAGSFGRGLRYSSGKLFSRRIVWLQTRDIHNSRGGGHNGTTIAAYLAKCGLSVCILEDRPELGACRREHRGGKPRPHGPSCHCQLRGQRQVGATRAVGSTASAWIFMPVIRSTGRWRRIHDRRRYVPGRRYVTMGFGKIAATLAHHHSPGIAESHLLVPSASPESNSQREHPVHAGLQSMHLICGPKELLRWTFFDFMMRIQYRRTNEDDHGLYRRGVRSFWTRGTGCPALCSVIAVTPPFIPRPVGPAGNIHGYFHALLRCAIAHGVVARTCCRWKR